MRIQDPNSKLWDRVGQVVGIGRHRDYHVKLPSGRIYWRNRRFLRQYYEAFEDDDEEEAEETEKPRKDDDDGKKEKKLDQEPRRSSRTKKKVVRFGVNHIKYFVQ